MVILARIVDLTGQHFGKLIVEEKLGVVDGRVKWKCKCDCGNHVSVITSLLRNGSVKSCGCLAKLNRWKNIAGQHFGRLVAMEYVGNSRWKCKCECGNEPIVLTTHLISGHTKSCGCIQKENTAKANIINIVGKKFGNLTVIQMETSRRCICQCVCGNIVHVARRSLINGTIHDCADVSTIDVSGYRFGKLTVLSQYGSDCACKCDCGKEITVKYGRLSSGHVKSCGCYKHTVPMFKNLIGKHFGNLTALSVSRKEGRTFWKCLCSCGNTCEIEISHLPYRTCCPRCSQHIGIVGSKDELEIKAFMDNLIAEVSYSQKGK